MGRARGGACALVQRNRVGGGGNRWGVGQARAMTPAELRRVLDGLLDHEDFCRESLTIRNKAGQTVPLVLSPAQSKLHRAIRAQEKRGVPVRVVALKARQVHMSVGAVSEFFKRVALMPGQQAMAFGDIYKSANNLWNYWDQFETSYRPYHGLAKLPLTGRQQHKRLDWAGGSWIQVGSADSVTTGRSYSLRHLHLSEYAFYRDAGSLMTGLMQCVPWGWTRRRWGG